MAFCGNCGTFVNEGEFCPKCGVQISDVAGMDNIAGKTNKRTNKRFKILLGIIVAAVVVIVAIVKMPHMVNKPCDWCEHKPSMAFKTSDGTMAYVCIDCSKECAICGEKASKHYENMLGMIVFVCDDCYKEVSDD